MVECNSKQNTVPLRVGVLLTKTNDSNAHIFGAETNLNIQTHRGMHPDILQDFEAKQSSLTASSAQKLRKVFWLYYYLLYLKWA